MRPSTLLALALLGCSPDADELPGPSPLGDVYDLDGDDLHPESGAYDPEQRAFFVGSLTRGDVTRIDADGGQSVFYAGTGEAGRATLGVQADPARRRLWVCSILEQGVEPGTVWVLDLDTGAQTHVFTLADTFADASCNDIDVDGQGRAYVTDRQNPHVYRIDADGDAVSIWADHPSLAPEIIGLNGVAFSRDGSALLVTKYLPARLLRIDANDPSDVVEVDLQGDAFAGQGLAGADGIAMRGDDLFVAFPDRVLRVVPEDAGWQRATVSALSGYSQLAAVTVAEGEVYAVKGGIVEYVLGGAPELPFQILRVDTGSR